MTTREIYFKAYTTVTKPVGILYYTYTDRYGVIHLGESVWLHFDKECHEDNIMEMEKIEKRNGFMFWNISDEGQKFVEDHSKELGELLSNLIMKQW
jgi:hypothetical protein